MGDLLDLSSRDLLGKLAVSEGAPGAGSAAAFVGAAAASLVAMAARASRGSWDGASGAVAQAEALRARLDPLAQADADAFGEALARLGEGNAGDYALGEALGRAADVPLAIAEASADVAELAAHVAAEARSDVRADVGAAALLAEAAARTGARLVEVNLATRPDDERVELAHKVCAAAARAARHALAAED
ncbi:MAG TPA: cyclodeaminase/cyclohydrolase family protein [Gaiellaceae bacterium]|jgi:formiminotetrahydrofolate cyclodeaminase